MRCFRVKTSIFVALALPFYAQTLPEGPGKAALIRVCGKCHSPERVITVHQRRYSWEETILKMVKLGAQGSDEELEAILNYLSNNFGTETPGPIDINNCRSIDLQASLVLPRSQANAVIEYRDKNGPFKTIDDLRSVPGLNFQLIEPKKSRIVF